MSKSKNKKKWLVCFDKQTGDMVETVRGSASDEKTLEKWRMKYDTIPATNEFFGTLEFIGMDAFQRSAWWKNVDTNVKYPMFIEDFGLLIRKSDLYRGQVTGKFGFVKHGQKCGIVILEEIKATDEGDYETYDRRDKHGQRRETFKQVPRRRHY